MRSDKGKAVVVGSGNDRNSIFHDCGGIEVKMRLCVKCGEAYVLTPSKPGYINECGECGAGDVALIGIPEHLLAVSDLVGVDQISELRGGQGN